LKLSGSCFSRCFFSNFDRDAEHWFQRAKNKGWAPNAVLYHNIINAYCKAGDMGKAEALVAEMEAEGLEAILGLYNTMMDGYAHCHDESKCLHVFHKLQASKQ
jgi:pentatricopeptide repeat protein